MIVVEVVPSLSSPLLLLLLPPHPAAAKTRHNPAITTTPWIRVIG
jgi:hypothetical protein